MYNFCYYLILNNFIFIKNNIFLNKMSLLIIFIIFISILLVGLGYFFIIRRRNISTTKYMCKDNSCVIDPNGKYNSLDRCQDNCEKPPLPVESRYSCSNDNGCVSDKDGIYFNLAECNKKCNIGPSDRKCIDNTSFQETAQDNVSKKYNNFYDCLSKKPFKCVRADEILSLRDYLSIFAFAYFPLNKNMLISYTTHSLDKKNLMKPKKSKVKITNDPVEVVIYYTSELYTLIGDLGDAKIGKNTKLINILSPLLDDLKQSCIDVFINNTMKDSNGNIIKGSPTWNDYFKYPGPNGRKWNNKLVDWTQDTKYQDKNNALYLNERDFLSKQFWGNIIPKQGSTTSQAISQLVQTQVDTSIKKYNDLINLGGSSKKWATEKILLDSDNIDTYHVFRKAIRSLDRTVEKFPQIIPAFYKKLSEQLVDFVNDNYNYNLSTQQTYGDILCLHNFTCNENIVYPVLVLIFVADPKLSPQFFGLSDADFNCIRALLLIKLGGLGSNKKEFSKQYLQNAIPCPSQLDTYPNSPYTWSNPSIKNSDVYGNICEIVDFFGDIHDQLVIIQQDINKGSKIDKDLFNYCVKSCQSLQTFLESIDMTQVLNNLKNGLCL
jgi:hypothetical protein